MAKQHRGKSGQHRHSMLHRDSNIAQVSNAIVHDLAAVCNLLLMLLLLLLLASMEDLPFLLVPSPPPPIQL
jgi:hypothetical protein